MPNLTAECSEYLDEFMALVADVNVYDIYGICYGTDVYPQIAANGKASRGYTAWDYTPWMRPRSPKAAANDLPPCTFGEPLNAWFN